MHRKKLKAVFLIALPLIVVIFFTTLFWLASSRPSDFYLFRSIRSGAVASLWLDSGFSSEAKKASLSADLIHLSLWLSPSRFADGMAHFDAWAQEYALLMNESEEAIEEPGQILPPSELPGLNEESVWVNDSYDLALQALLEDLWNSEFFVLSGSVHFSSPVWMKPLLGGLASGAVEQPLSRFFDARLFDSGLRDDGADLLSWLSEVPFAHLGKVEHSPGFVVETVFDVGGEQLAGLHIRLCELGNLPQPWCEGEEFPENPLLPFLWATESFKAQFKIYWALRGDHVVWSNSRECLLSQLSTLEAKDAPCGEMQTEATQKPLALKERSIVRSKSARGSSLESGFFLNQVALQDAFERIEDEITESPLDGAEWIYDFLQTRDGRRLLIALRSRLRENAFLLPSVGSAVRLIEPNEARLSTFVRRFQAPGATETSTQPLAEKYFNFLYGLTAAWRGLPHGPGRMEESRPWKNQNSFWTVDSDFRLGWRESE